VLAWGLALVATLLALGSGRAAAEPGVVVQGQVVTEEGIGVGDATVYVQRAELTVAEATTDEAGQFRLELADPGRIDVRVGKALQEKVDSPQASWVTLTAEALEVEPSAGPLRLVVRSDPCEATVRVRVSSSEGNVVGAMVRAPPVMVPYERKSRWPKSRTNAIGRVDLGGLPRIPVEIHILRHPPWCPARGPVVLPDPMGIDLHRVLVERERILTGHVLDGNGRPVVGCGVMATSERATASRPWGDVTGADGVFRIGVPESWDDATLLVGCEQPREGSSHDLSVPIATTMAAAASPLKIVLDAAAVVRGNEDGGGLAASKEQDASRRVMEAVLRAHYLVERRSYLVLLQDLGGLREADDAARYLGDGVQQTTLLDLERKAQGPAVLPPDLDPGLQTIVLRGRWVGYLHKTHGWDGYRHFNRRFPGAFGLLTLSPVGFSEDGLQAVMHVSWMLWPRVGEGHYYLLENRDGAWHVVRRAMTWIS